MYSTHPKASSYHSNCLIRLVAIATELIFNLFAVGCLLTGPFTEVFPFLKVFGHFNERSLVSIQLSAPPFSFVSHLFSQDI
jgi:hypothetical protein